MTISILKTERFYPLGKPIQRPAKEGDKPADVQVRPGVFRKADGTFETRDYQPPAEPTKPAPSAYRCERCCDTGRVMTMVCYGGPPVESEDDCPDCDGEESA